jgi:hypothetical protein
MGWVGPRKNTILRKRKKRKRRRRKKKGGGDMRGILSWGVWKSHQKTAGDWCASRHCTVSQATAPPPLPPTTPTTTPITLTTTLTHQTTPMAPSAPPTMSSGTPPFSS